MKIAGIPRTIVAANASVVQELASAGRALKGATAGSRGLAATLENAMEAVANARAGAQNLGGGNLLDAALGRWALHAERDLQRAATMANRSTPLSRDGVRILNGHLDDARSAIRLGTEAGERSLASPKPRAIERATAFAGASTDSAGNGPVWVDGAWLDELGNPVSSRGGRGGSTWAGPDGQQFDWDGAPVRGGGDGYVSGPDGSTYVGI